MQLQNASLTELTHYLQNQDFIGKNETVINTSIPGEGNMNYTIRVETDEQSIIVKQANPFVQKYQQIPAPQQRALTEASFYITVQDNNEVAGKMPGFLGVDAQNFILVLEDLGHGKDCTYLYKKEEHLSEKELKDLCSYLSALHGNFKAQDSDNVNETTSEATELMANRQLRVLNHEHIFVYPFMEEKGFNLDDIQSGLQQIAATYKQDAALKEKALDLGKHYLADGNVLLHGDFYPGSWLKTGDDIKIIDPEFCFYGSPEIDLGIMTAHLYLAGEPDSLIEQLQEYYLADESFDQELCKNFTGIEIIRRIIGLAQLPLSLSLPEKESLLKKAKTLLS